MPADEQYCRQPAVEGDYVLRCALTMGAYGHCHTKRKQRCQV